MPINRFVKFVYYISISWYTNDVRERETMVTEMTMPARFNPTYSLGSEALQKKATGIGNMMRGLVVDPRILKTRDKSCTSIAGSSTKT